MKMILLFWLSICSFYQLTRSELIMSNLHLPDIEGEHGTGNYRQKRETGSLLRDAVRGVVLVTCNAQHLAESAITFATGAELPSGMSVDQGASIRLYTAKCFVTALNDQLENNYDSGQFRLYVDILRSALSKLPVQHGRVWRGSRVNLTDYMVGAMVTWKPFSSTTTDQSFAIDSIKNTHGNVLFEIERSQGYDIGEFSEYPSEEDILLPLNMIFRVRSLETSTSETYRKCVLEQLTSSANGFILTLAFHISKTILASTFLAMCWHF